MDKHILFLAGSDIDSFYEVDSFLGPSDACLAKPIGTKIGGCILNAAVVCSMLGSDVKVLDYLKKDDEGTDLLIEGLNNKKVDTSYIQYGEDVINGSCLIMKKGDDKCIYVVEPKRPYFEEDDNMKNLLFNSKYIYTTMATLKNSFKNLDIIMDAKRNGTKIIFDGESQYLDLSDKNILLEYADGVFMNKNAYNRLMKACDFEPIDYLLGNGLNFACITDGENGATCYTLKESIYKKAFKVNVVDSTGAGDSFAGCFLHFLDKGLSYEECLNYASYNGSLACTRDGGMAGAVSEEELNDFMTNN